MFAIATDPATTIPIPAVKYPMTIKRMDGFVRIVLDANTGLVLGKQAVGASVSELASEFALAIAMCTAATDVAETIHAQPILDETVQEARHIALDHALHI